MEEKSTGNGLKRPFREDENSDKQPPQKRVRFPKGKKVKPGYEVVDGGNAEKGSSDLKDPRHAATERAKRRSQINAELLSEETEGFLNDVSAAEETYEDDGDRIEDGIQIEPFNLEKEREEGYFDADGNFVEYMNENNKIKDAWLDSIEADPKYARSAANDTENNEDEIGNEDANDDLSSDEIGMIKRRIANVLEPGETVLQALRRLKGNSNNRKEKMSAETKHVFEQLTEDADKLIQNGEYNVYHEKQEVFEREAEGYERLSQVKKNETLLSAGLGTFGPNVGDGLYSDTNGSASGSATGHSTADATATEISDGDGFDMFADDDRQGVDSSVSDGSTLASGPNSEVVTEPSSEAMNISSEAGASQYGYTTDGSDYIYDESSGYYYSSSLGYYYDPSTGLYCSATTGQWYAFNAETGEYEEVKEAASSAS